MSKRSVALLLLLVLLSGCWSRVELNDFGVVTGIGVDMGEEKPVRLTLYIPGAVPLGLQRTGGMTRQNPVWIVTREAETLSDAIRLIRQSAARHTSLHHVRVVLISEEYARTRGLADLLDFLATNEQIRLTLRPFVVKGRTQAVFESTPPLKPLQPSNLRSILEARGRTPWRLKELLVGRVSQTHSTWMYSAELVDRSDGFPGSSEKEARVSGAALMLGDFLERILEGRDSQMLHWFVGNPRQTVITTDCPDPQEGTFSAMVLRGKVKIIPSLKGQEVSFRVEATTRFNLVRTECPLETQDAAVRRRVEERLAEELRRSLERFIAILQETGVDPVGFGKRMQLAYPAYFRGLGDGWREIWPTAKVEVSSRVTMPYSGLISGPPNRSRRELQIEK